MTFNFFECFDENIDNLDITKTYIYVLHLFTFQMPIFNKPHKYLFLGFYYSIFYFICKKM